MGNTTGKVLRSIKGGVDGINRATRGLRKGFSKALPAATIAGLGFTKVLKDAVMVGVDFEQTMVNAAAKFPGNIRKGTKEFKILEDAAKKVGKTTEFKASEAAQGLNFLAMAGFNAEQAVSSLPSVVNLATAAGIDLSTATDVATDSLGAFNLMTKDASKLGENLSRVNDVIAVTTVRANTNVEQLFESFKEGGPVATTAGASLETYAALAGKLADAGIKGTQSGTTLKNMFLSLTAKTPLATKTLAKLGVQTEDSAGNMKDIITILGDLNKSLEPLGTAKKSAVLKNIFGRIPIAGVNVLLKTGTKNLNAFRNELINSRGESQRLADVMRDTLGGRLKTVGSIVENVGIKFFDLVKGPLQKFLDKTIEWFRNNEKIVDSILNGIVFALGLVVKGFKAVGTWIGEALAEASIFGEGLGRTLAKITNFFRTAKTNIKKFFVDLWEDVLNITDKAIGKITSKIKELNPFQEFGEDLGKAAFDLFGRSEPPKVQKRLVTPEQSLIRSIKETKETKRAEVTIKDETGRAELTKGSLGSGLMLQATGAF